MVLAVYNLTVFGRLFDTGYQYASPYQSLFLWEDNPAIQVEGIPTWLAQPSMTSFIAALVSHLVQWAQPAFLGWPFFPLAIVSLLIVIVKRQLEPPIWLAVLWLLATYAPYAGIVYFGITRELAVPVYRSWGFFAVDRYLFPASLPLAFLTTSLLSKFPRYLGIVLTIIYVLVNVWVYWQTLVR